MKTGWMFIDQAAWRRCEPADKISERNAMVLDVSFSPYDIPTAVRGEFDESMRKFVIKFRYVWPEEGSTQHASGDQHVDFVIGKISGRLLQIHIDVDSAKVDTLVLKSRAMSAVADLTASESRYEPMRHALKEFFSERNPCHPGERQ